ncbi:uncharacterized protein K02A2.6-like [Hydractinia symbiolongicarpus]|uniref:uncharacterized protein K02A2.6-like n=1 Tax=Hydractinia symbiolongicarpus TaxID=13093 RepID=UPI0025505ABD|nr:uncharacterized protein K02A2.6-like [Hydractinia symbiolongicarpus]
MSVLQLPAIPPFDPNGEPTSVGQRWTKWQTSLKYYILASGVRDDERKRAILLHMIGPKCQEIFETFSDPGTTFEEALHKFDEHFSVKKNIPFERHKFHQASQQVGESTDQFITRLRQLSLYCEYGSETDNEIRDMVIAKTSNIKFRKRLLMETDLNLQKTQDLGRLFESAEHQNKEIANGKQTQHDTEEESSEQINKLHGRRPPHRSHRKHNAPPHRNNPTKSFNKPECGRCGMKNHKSHECRRSRDKTCNKCGIKGHFAKMCRTKNKQQVHQTNHENSDDEDEDIYLYKMNTTKSNNFPVLVNNSEMTAIIDSGSTTNIIDFRTYKRLFSNIQLQKSNARIYPYNATKKLPITGTFKATVAANHHKILAKFYVIPGQGGNLLGHKTAEQLDLLRIGPATTPINHRTFQLGSRSLSKGIPVSTEQVLNKNNKVFKGMGKLNNFKQKLHIDPDVTPIQQPTRRLPFHTRKKVEAELDRLLKLDIIEPVNGPTSWVSPIVAVPKKNGKIRLCVDMRRANTAIIREKHPIPKLEEILPLLNGATVFSKIDLREGYHQIELAEESRNITAFITHKGIFRYKRLIYGISSAFEHFQKNIEMVIADCEGAKNISDDIFIWGKTQAEHDRNLDKVLRNLSENGLRVNPEKCEFSKNKILFSGYTLTTDGISPDPSKVTAVNKFKTPTTSTEVRSFLGLVNYCSQFIKDYSTLSAPLRKLTKKNTPFIWTDLEQKSFDLLKEKLCTSETMAFYNPEAETDIIVDASPYGLGAILTQKQKDGNFKPVAYGSRALTPVEQRYSQTEREALAVAFGCTHFHFFIYDRDFDITTDHKSLLHVMSPTSTSPPPRIQRWLLRIQGYNYKLKYISGAKNAADILSRDPVCTDSEGETDDSIESFINFTAAEAVPKSCNIEEIQDETAKDIILQKVTKAINSKAWPKDSALNPYRHAKHELSFVNNILLKGQRIVIPSTLQQKMLQIAHATHQGTTKTKLLLREKVWWPLMNKQIEDLTLTCHACEVTAPSTTRHEPSQPTEIPKQPWNTIAMDIQGPYPSGDNLLVLIDYRSRYPIVSSIKNTGVQNIINVMKRTFSIFGYPKTIVTDNGSQFTSFKFSRYLQQHGIKHRRTTPYWPQANGEVERFNRTLKRHNQTAVITGKDWRKTLDTFLLSYRTTPHTVTKVPPATLMFGRPLTNDLPDVSQLVKSNSELDIEVNKNDEKHKQKSKENTDQNRKAKTVTFEVGQKVLLKNLTDNKNKLSPPWLKEVFTIIKVYKRSIMVRNKEGKTFLRANGHAKLYRSAKGKQSSVSNARNRADPCTCSSNANFDENQQSKPNDGHNKEEDLYEKKNHKNGAKTYPKRQRKTTERYVIINPKRKKKT